MILVTATHTPTAAATIGMIQTRDTPRLFAATRALRIGDSGWSGILYLARTCVIPDQTRVERLYREHPKYDHGGKE
jgi:hypothetical protein